MKDLSGQLKLFTELDNDAHTQRLLFMKVKKGFSEQAYELATAQHKLELLQAQVTNTAVRKRKAVQINPNTKFANIKDIQKAQVEAGDKEDITDESSEADLPTFASNSLTLGESQDLIHKLLESYKGQTVTLVIDALDECNEATRSSLLELLESLLKTPAILKIFVSSRDDQDIVYNLKQYENLFLSSRRNSEDIALFVRSETRRLIEKKILLRGSARQEELRDRIIFELTSKAHGMFRWASLHMQELCRQATDAAIEERLVKMPKTLEGLYREILEKIENRDALADRAMAKNAFSWLLCAREQLRSDVFLAFVSVLPTSHPKSRL
ncbi:hypothetical protein CH063_04050 [Colletotrichum higginsianum]|uniref:Nephrocystin 3-like N-terminal domain-containing protein n=1 Tax=Colletotrichum higginsianum (strain IMI 349063) TaxID=759273 RepID=H1W3M8_COLHI|nr:hypothetical protein CH063_04050 [Colletotrichum higginsianum]